MIVFNAKTFSSVKTRQKELSSDLRKELSLSKNKTTTRKYSEFAAKNSCKQKGVNQKKIGNIGLCTEAMKSTKNADTKGCFFNQEII